MTKLKAYITALIFWVFFPIRWWEGKPLIAILMMVFTCWFISAGETIYPFFYVGAFAILAYELMTLQGRLERENTRLAKLSK